jgi:hypothetical protein
MHHDELHYDPTDTYDRGLARYQEYIDRIEQKITLVREHYLKRIELGGSISAGLFFVALAYYFFFTPSAREIALNPQLNHAPLLPWILLGGVVLGIAAAWPIFAYKNHTDRLPDGTKIRVTLKEITFKKAFQFFGDFTLKPTGAIDPAFIKASQLLPHYDESYSEDLITGTYANAQIQMCESHVIDSRDKKNPLLVFKGMIVLLTLPASASCKGRTVVVQDEHKDLPALAQKFAGFTRVDLPNSDFEAHYEALTTDAAEANHLLTLSFLETMESLFSTLRNTSRQVMHTDDKIVAMLASTRQLAKDAAKNPRDTFLTLQGQLQRIAKGSKQLSTPDFTALTQGDSYSVNNTIQCSFFENHVLFTIPYDNDLFEPNSVFERAFEAEDVTLTYALMACVFRLVDNLLAERA